LKFTGSVFVKVFRLRHEFGFCQSSFASFLSRKEAEFEAEPQGFDFNLRQIRDASGKTTPRAPNDTNASTDYITKRWANNEESLR
jgi:hypothetical protein